ncbi:NAD(P)/FAD-dependent oxidoreductase [Streptomyces roseochromogenus]|uniref:Thioredoxin reductase n=1 Tax=Streptomyces roseochromogenus subsp. oscitans DS 12.976 TaxID=1352936 RepID=V6JNP8_STRRC|nr:NAD(P)/FAD-dependent oxidoreductase [Streptomyces roseochromogenus]EST20726.1 thioredoxin reductase [Streptomyces roseochromogenus subsp. oscitans DS 12.976]
MTENNRYEAVVVGGGAAGLSAALVLGRARRHTLVVDAGEPRNAPSAHMQGYLSRDGMSPAEFLAVGREEIARYGVELVRDRVVDAGKDAGGFTATLAGGRTVRARQLVIATGLKDELPEVPGLAERFGRDVVHCPYCHGWEVRDLPTGVLATSPLSVHQALMVTQWTKDVRFFLHEMSESELTDDDLRRLAAAGVAVVPGKVAELVVTDDRLTGVRLTGGTPSGEDTVHDREVLYVAPRAVPNNDLLVRLGAELRETPFGSYPVIDERGLTSVPGLWAAGNASGFAEQVINAASRGYRAGAALNAELLFADLDASAPQRGAGNCATSLNGAAAGNAPHQADE